MQNVTLEYIKENGELKLSKADQIKLTQFIKNLPDGSKIECYHSLILDPSEKTLRQLTKVHVMIKQLATDTGSSMSEMKKHVKERAGIISYDDNKNKIEKSFADCSKSDLNSAIQECILIGEFVGSDVY